MFLRLLAVPALYSQTHLKHVEDLLKLRDAKPNESEWNSSDYKTAIKTVKTAEDGKMPTLKNDLREMWKNLKAS